MSFAAVFPPITNGRSLSVHVRFFPTTLFRTRLVAPPVFSSIVRLTPTTLSATRKNNPALPSMRTFPLGTWFPPPIEWQAAPGSDPPNATELSVPVTWTLPPMVAPQMPTATKLEFPVVPVALTFPSTTLGVVANDGKVAVLSRGNHDRAERAGHRGRRKKRRIADRCGPFGDRDASQERIGQRTEQAFSEMLKDRNRHVPSSLRILCCGQ